MVSQYRSPFTVGKRPTVYIDSDDPRVQGFKANITAARLGAELVVSDSRINTINQSGRLSNVGASSPKQTSSGINPKSANFTKPGDITNLAAVWEENDGYPSLKITFDFDFGLAENEYVDSFRYKLFASSSVSTVITSTDLNKSGTQQTLNFNYNLNTGNFGEFQGAFTELQVTAYDSFGNAGNTAVLSVIPAYVAVLCTPVITATSIMMGYAVDWDPCPTGYDKISIEEVISNALTAPVSGYQQVYLNNIKPATILTSTTESRWVRARFTSKAGTYGSYSTAVKVTPTSPVQADVTPPNEVSSVSAVWNGDNIDVTYVLPTVLNSTKSVTNASWASGTVTFTANNDYVTGQTVNVYGSSNSLYNVSGVITARNATTFSVALVNNPGTFSGTANSVILNDAGQSFIIELTPPSGSRVGFWYPVPTTTNPTQIYTITKNDQFNQFGAYYTQYSGIIKSVDSSGNRSAGVSFNVDARVNPLLSVVPTFTGVGISNGYTVNYTLPTTAAYGEVYQKYTSWSGITNPKDFYNATYSSGGASGTNTLVVSGVVDEHGASMTTIPTGYRITGTGIPANTFVSGVSGTSTLTLTLSTYNSSGNVIASNLTEQASGTYTITALVYFGSSPAVVSSTLYGNTYVIIRWFTSYNEPSLVSSETILVPINPAVVDNTVPNTPTVASSSISSDTITVNISTTDSTTKGYRLRYKKSTDTIYTTEIVAPISAFSAGTSTTAYSIKSLIPGTIYNISAAGYNQYNGVGSFSTDINLTTSSVTVSTPSAQSLSLLPYGVLASWTVASNTPTPISKYRVELYNSSNVLIITQFTFSNRISFTGLTSGTTYYVKVSAQDIYDNYSNPVTSANVTLGASVQSTDLYDGSVTNSAIGAGAVQSVNIGTNAIQSVNIAPNAVQSVNLAPFSVQSVNIASNAIQSVNIAPNAIQSINLAPLSVQAANLAANSVTANSIQAGAITTNALAAQSVTAANMAANSVTTYSLAAQSVTAGNIAANAVTTYSLSAQSVTANNIAANAVTTYSLAAQSVQAVNMQANSVTAGSIQAATITGTQVNASSLLVGKLFSVGSGTGETFPIRIDATANPTKLYSGTAGIYNDLNTPFYLDSAGKLSLKDRLSFDGNNTLTVNGVINAQSGSFTGNMTIGTSPQMKIGSSVNGSLNGIYIDNNNYWYTNGNFAIGANNNAVSWDGTNFNVTGSVNASRGSFSGPILMGSSGYILLGTSATITNVSGNGTTITYTANNSFTAGQTVTITGVVPGVYNLTNATIATRTATQFTVTNSATGTYQYGGLAIMTNSGRRIQIDSGTISAYDTSGLTTQIVGDSSSAYTFRTTNAEIGGFRVDSAKIQNIATSGTYAGISTSGTYAIYAGASDGGSGALFGVTSAGAVQASNITVSGGSIDIGGSKPPQTTATGTSGASTITVASNAGITSGMYVYGTGIANGATVSGIAGTTITLSRANTGTVSGTITFVPTGAHILSSGDVYATNANLRGNIVATAGTIEGDLQVVSGSFYTGTSPTSNSVVINTSGLAAYSTSGAVTEILTSPLNNGTTNGGNTIPALPAGINFFTKGALIGGWYVDATRIQDSAQQFILDSSNKLLSLYGSISGTNYGFKMTSNANNFIEAGTRDGSNNIPSPTFSVTKAGILNAVGGLMTTASTGNIMKFGKGADGGTNDGIYIDANDYWYSDGKFSLGNGIITYNGSLLEINPARLSNTSFKIKLNVTSNEDGTFGDSTLVQSEDGEMTIGRAFFYGSNVDPRTGNGGGPITSRAQHNSGSQGSSSFLVGDIWLQRV